MTTPRESKGNKRGRPGARQIKSQATRLVELASGAELFHTSEGDAYATVVVKGHRETWPVRSTRFRQWMIHQFYEQEHRAPAATALTDAKNTLEARARIDGPQREVHLRLAEYRGDIFLDLADENWNVVKITSREWDVIQNPPVKFRRPLGMQSLPRPLRRGRLHTLQRYLNVVSEADWALILGWLVGTLNPGGPYPILVLHGEQGSAKSTTARFLGLLVDPHAAPLRSVPKDMRDLMISATNGRLLSFDNVSHLPLWFSDALAQLSTGGALVTRELYTDREEVILRAQQPIILNGIEELATRPDLLDRAVILYLPGIPDHKRRLEKDLRESFKRDRPRILGALLKAVSTALRRLPRVQDLRLPRMADFAKWVTAAEPALGLPEGAFLNAYATNIDSASDLALESSLVATAIQDFVNTEAVLSLVPELGADAIESGEWSWTGTASDLLRKLEEWSPDLKRQRGWPRSPAALSNALRRLMPVLRRRGIELEFDRREGHERRRVIVLRKSGENIGRVDRLAAPSRQGASDDPLPPLPDIAGDAADDLPIIFADPDPAKQGVPKATGTPPPRPATRKVRRR